MNHTAVAVTYGLTGALNTVLLIGLTALHAPQAADLAPAIVTLIAGLGHALVVAGAFNWIKRVTA